MKTVQMEAARTGTFPELLAAKLHRAPSVPRAPSRACSNASSRTSSCPSSSRSCSSLVAQLKPKQEFRASMHAPVGYAGHRPRFWCP
eukprot:CAMPEP_0175375144 /NCGR_PEP_ID=MMETSP0095-20121207/23614_1 /TAXON_ID=311494 /ORGANISM="Alexandrium monilatum, Strain CCMP3105" /LENGTH=86 /DNA_ID=CAMNT_0016673399 /DNA_START=152 /DNA_END=412 /DNA_ORIENTATION=+